MKATRSVLLATAVCVMALPALAHTRPELATADLVAAPAGSGPCHEASAEGVAVAGLPTAIKVAGAFEQQGLTCALAGNLRPAIGHFSQAIQRFPWRPQSYANRGQAYAGLGEYEFAVLDYDDAIRLDPKQQTYRYLRAVSLSEIGRAEEAVYDLEKVLKLNDRKVVSELQRYLAVKGFDPGPIDGVYGPSTRRALIGCVSDRCFSF
ncbi:Putative peptidoglycan binding domain-containing protein [Tistlia consotensis]|uniref:Putative peptidoglycan binding domain-containing protein n=1 Tax=Tistlia consotensis USBA 355 TaxID=560819 RepID=A0A1Y6CRX1_9PROT|nr:tetratricopeptide repeat protein [Tistlia consotensis]SMF74870.1 Putative peptidoglycan binding domain-containing protein [Tistlia consotensis USBA 355]SNS11280.1 Putative peptidoglycan binding domain-containing protein [Tistlia consotensis]